MRLRPNCGVHKSPHQKVPGQGSASMTGREAQVGPAGSIAGCGMHASHGHAVLSERGAVLWLIYYNSD
uniref:Uncharacterized protein n=1 Tax=Pristionchus pacificus TaxID=54126 RepID=A0A2A6CKR0_PRIPA|eukprot:PDM78667.1 hypothetical protein PRIPAC_31246 [Pristionchus pacificus]